MPNPQINDTYSTDITLADLTSSTTVDNGTGVFDVLIKAVNMHINDQYEKGRITGVDYANVYLGAMQSVIAQSVQFLLGREQAILQAGLTAEKLVSEKKNNEPDGTIDLKDKLLEAQTLGFKLDSKQKILKSMLDGYAVNLSLVGSADVPETVLEQSIDQLSQEMLNDLTSSVVIQKDPATGSEVQAPAEEIANPAP